MGTVIHKFRYTVVNHVIDNSDAVEYVIGGFHNIMNARLFCLAFLGDKGVEQDMSTDIYHHVNGNETLHILENM